MRLNINIGDVINLADILRNQEGENLDYKSQYATVNSDLIHDVLCLANSVIDSDRLLIFGINDDKSVVGVENDPNRKNQADILNVLRTSRLVKSPNVFLKTEQYENHEVDILVIKNESEKPYFLTEDYTASGRPLRAGVIYSRVGDTNTPINRTTSDHIIEKMFLERLGFDKTPMERLIIYLKQVDLWKYGHNDSGLYFYHTLFPEFTIQEKGDREHCSYVEPWCMEFPDQNASRTEFYLKYNSTVLGETLLIWLDGARLKRIQPRQKVINTSGVYYQSFYYIQDSIDYLINSMISSVYEDLDHRASYDEFFKVFESDEQAQTELDNSFAQQDDNNTFYYFNKEEDDYFRLDGTEMRKLFWAEKRKYEAPTISDSEKKEITDISKLLSRTVFDDYVFSYVPFAFSIGIISLVGPAKMKEGLILTGVIGISFLSLISYVYKKIRGQRLKKIYLYFSKHTFDSPLKLIQNRFDEITSSYRFSLAHNGLILSYAILIFICSSIGESLVQNTLLESDGVTLISDWKMFLQTFVISLLICSPFYFIFNNLISITNGNVANKQLKIALQEEIEYRKA